MIFRFRFILVFTKLSMIAAAQMTQEGEWNHHSLQFPPEGPPAPLGFFPRPNLRDYTANGLCLMGGFAN